VSALNETLLAQNQELETQLSEESQEKASKHLLIPLVIFLLEYYPGLTLSFSTATIKEWLAALGVDPDDQNSAAESLATLKNELAKEKLTWEKTQADVDTLFRAVEELKKSADQLAAQVPSLETKVKNLDDKVAELNIKLQSRELSLERTTAAKDDFQHQNTQLTEKLEGKHSSSCHLSLIFVLCY
jgi:septal ring factor EnvC (AmiA/AmiB activator)